MELQHWYGRTRDIEGEFRLLDWVRPIWEQARDQQWSKVFETLTPGSFSPPWCRPYLNACCPYNEAQYSFLHIAAIAGASVEIVERMIGMGAWRTLQNAHGERPVDIARRHAHAHLYDILEPKYKRHVPPGILLRIQHLFHDEIRRWDGLGPALDKFGFRLPQLEPMLELDPVNFHFDVFFWCGGFNYELVADGVDARLACSGGSRVVGGSEGKIEITSAGVKVLPL